MFPLFLFCCREQDVIFLMMIIKPGSIIKESQCSGDPHFKDAVIVIAEHNDTGSLGFIVNRKFARRLNELEEFANGKAFPIYIGGPVMSDKLYFIHCRPDLIENGQMICPDLFLGGNFKQALMQMNNGSLREKDIQIFLGYCGWDESELEEEIFEGSWSLEEKPFQISDIP